MTSQSGPMPSSRACRSQAPSRGESAARSMARPTSWCARSVPTKIAPTASAIRLADQPSHRHGFGPTHQPDALCRQHRDDQDQRQPVALLRPARDQERRVQERWDQRQPEHQRVEPPAGDGEAAARTSAAASISPGPSSSMRR